MDFLKVEPSKCFKDWFSKKILQFSFAGGWAPGLILKDNFVLYLRASLIITIFMFHICKIVVTQSENFFEKSKFQTNSI